MKIANLGTFIAAFGPFLVETSSFSKDAEKCAVCYGIADNVEKKMKETEKRADENIKIGVRLGPSGEELPKSVIKYGDSRQRLDEVLEEACKGSEQKSYCHEILHDQDENIAKWFHERRNSHKFATFICDSKIPGCSAKVVSEVKAKKSKAGDEPKKATSPASPSSNLKKETAKKALAAKNFLQVILERMKRNTQRIRDNGLSMYHELKDPIRGKDWPKLKKILINKQFYTKYWNVILWIGIFIYMFSCMVDSIINVFKPKAAPARRIPSNGVKKNKQAASTSTAAAPAQGDVRARPSKKSSE